MSYAVSASQIKTWQQCPRKWAFSKLARVPRVDAPWFAFGTELHRQAEAWLRDGAAPDQLTKEGRLLSLGLELLPEPGTCLGLEERLTFEYAGINWIAILDCIAIDPDSNEVLILDHKTIGDRRRALTNLADDVQAMIYVAAIGIDRGLPGDAPLRLRWVYYPKNGGNPWPLDCAAKVCEGLKTLERLAPTAQVMSDLYAEGHKTIEWCNENVECVPSACESCGVFCDAGSLCNLTNNNPVRKETTMAETAQEIIARYRAKQAAPAPAPASEVPMAVQIGAALEILNRSGYKVTISNG